MKKLLFLILILFGGIGIQTARAQCAQPYEMSRIPDYKAFLNADVDLTFGNYVTSATITKELVLPDGDLVIAGYFDKICQYDGTNTGITQTLTGLQGLARRDGITGIWSSLPTIVGVNYPYTYPYRIWYLDDTLYCWVSGSNGIRKLNPVTNTWSPIIFPYHVTNIVSAGTPFEYYVSFHSSYQGAVIDYVGLRKWNTQTGAMTVITGSTLPDFSSQFTINETQTSDTLTVILHDLSTSPMILIKGQTSLIGLDIPSIGIESPHAGYSAGLMFDWVNDVIFLPNNDIYAVVTRSMPDITALMKWNYSIQKWDSVDSRTGFTNSDMDVFFYDAGTNTLNAEALGVVDLQTSKFTEAHVILGYPYAVPKLRQGNTWYNGGALLEDITAPTAPNTTTPSGIVSIIGEQYVLFTGDNAHDGDLATMYDCCNNILHTLSIDATNCSNFVFNHLVPLGTNVYYFSLTDPSGNESTKTQITVVASWSTGISDIDKDFATVSTLGKTIFIKGDVSKIEVYDLNAKVIFSSRVNSNEFTQSFNYLPSGMYFVKVSNTLTKQMMVQNITLN